jgi:hypothetical protein
VAKQYPKLTKNILLDIAYVVIASSMDYLVRNAGVAGQPIPLPLVALQILTKSRFHGRLVWNIKTLKSRQYSG